MERKSLTRSVDGLLADLAARQFGVVTRRQLLLAGVGAGEITARLERSRLHRLHRGVYLVGHTVAPRFALEIAALLACGPRAVLSHRTAAALWDLLPHPAQERVCVTVPPGHGATRPNLRIHRATLDRRDIRTVAGLRRTSPPRTILDLSAELGDEQLERIVAEARYRRLASERELIAQLERNPRKRGTRRLRRVLDLPGGPQRTRSPAERALLRLLRANGVTGFECNARICGYEVDFLWRERRFAVEVDGYDAHSGRAAFERDRLKLATLQANGVRVMPMSGRQVTRDPDGVLARVLGALD
jgi:very-short-patch-repair endonuclease